MHTSALLFTVLSVLKFSTAVPVTDVDSVDVTPAKLVSVQITGDNFTATVAAPQDPTLAGADATLADATLADATLADATLADATLADVTLADADATLADADATLADATLADATLADATLADATLADATLADATLADATLADVTLADADLAVTGLEAVAPADFTKAQVISAGGNSATSKQVMGSSLSGGFTPLFPFSAASSCEAAVAERILAEVEGDVEDTINDDINNGVFLAAQIAAIAPFLNALVTGVAVTITQVQINALLASLMTALTPVDMSLANRLITDVRQDFRRVGDLEGRFDRCRFIAQTPTSSTSVTTVTATVTQAGATAAPAAAPTVFVFSGPDPDIQSYPDIGYLNIFNGFDDFAKTEE
jgi:uncharacterized protein YjbI with pentapeptide repeats